MVRRVAVVLVASLAAAWFGLGARQAMDTDKATAMLSAGSSVSVAEAEHVRSLLRAAGELNPDRQIALLQGQLALERGRPQRAQRLISQVTRAEPQNLAAWIALARAATDNAVLFHRALVRVRALEPLLPFR
jgi:hypothetical protein